MGLEIRDIIAISALVLSLITFIFALYRTRKIGPKIDLFHAKLTGKGLVDNDKTYYIGVSVYAENYGDKATDLMTQTDVDVLLEGNLYEKVSPRLNDNHKAFFESIFPCTVLII